MVVAAKAVAIAMVVVVAAAIVAKAPAAVAPRTAGPAADADQAAAQPKLPEAAAVVAVLEPKPVLVEASQKQNADPAKTLAAAPRAPPAKTMK